MYKRKSSILRYKEGLKDILVQMNPFITREGNGRAKTNAYIEGGSEDVGIDIFEKGLCLPSDNKMTAEE